MRSTLPCVGPVTGWALVTTSVSRAGVPSGGVSCCSPTGQDPTALWLSLQEEPLDLASLTPTAREHASAPAPPAPCRFQCHPSCSWWGRGGQGPGLWGRPAVDLPGPEFLGPDPLYSQNLSRWLTPWPLPHPSWRVSVGRRVQKQCPGCTVGSIVQAFLGSVGLEAGHRAGIEELGASWVLLGGVHLPMGQVTSYRR